MKKITGAKTGLERHVQGWINEQAVEYDNGAEGVLKDLFKGGCASGMVGHLIYYEDTIKFFKAHRREISGLLSELISETGESVETLFCDKWDKSDPLALEVNNQNLLAWFGFEEAARKLANLNEIEI